MDPIPAWCEQSGKRIHHHTPEFTHQHPQSTPIHAKRTHNPFAPIPHCGTAAPRRDRSTALAWAADRCNVRNKHTTSLYTSPLPTPEFTLQRVSPPPKKTINYRPALGSRRPTVRPARSHRSHHSPPAGPKPPDVQPRGPSLWRRCRTLHRRGSRRRPFNPRLNRGRRCSFNRSRCRTFHRNRHLTRPLRRTGHWTLCWHRRLGSLHRRRTSYRGCTLHRCRRCPF